MGRAGAHQGWGQGLAREFKSQEACLLPANYAPTSASKTVGPNSVLPLVISGLDLPSAHICPPRSQITLDQPFTAWRVSQD
jgi:hypothetical protein